MLVGVFFDLVKIRGKNQEVGFYYNDNSPPRSSKYQHNKNQTLYIQNHSFINQIGMNYQNTIAWHSYGCIDSGPQYANFIPVNVKFV